MCRSSSEPGGPKRCSGDTRESYSRAATAVLELERSEAALDEGMRQRRELDAKMELEAVGYVRSWLESHRVEEIRVDDEHDTPGYALDFDDAALDSAISWLPPSMIHNPTHPAWNPVVRLSDLKDFLARTGGEDQHRDGPGEAPVPQSGDSDTPQPPSRGTQSRCTCHVVREFSGGHFGSLASIGAECGHCIAAQEQCEFEEWWASLTPQERIKNEIGGRWYQARERLRKLGRRPGAPPAADWPF